MTEFTVRAAEPGDAETCAQIALGLPDYFTPDVPDKVRAETTEHGGWVLTGDGEVLGFAIVSTRFPSAAEIRWAAVRADRRGFGLGTTLIEAVLAELRTAGVCLVEVKTLDPSAEYPPYTATYAFWLARGFTQIDLIDPLPEWGPGNPAAILVAALPRSR